MKDIRDWFPFYPGRWADPDLQLCSMGAQGLLIGMMSLSWRIGSPGRLIYPPGEVARLLLLSEAEFRPLLDELKSRGRVRVSQKGIEIPALVEIGEEQHEKHRRRVEAGKKGPKKKPTSKGRGKKEKGATRRSELQDAEIERKFEEFWKMVPNKIGKGYAKSCFKNALKRSSFEKIVAGLPTYAEYEKKRRKRPDYQPLHPSTWLNQDRWHDSLLFNTSNQIEESIMLACGRTVKFRGVSKEDVAQKKQKFILDKGLQRKKSHKGAVYYEEIDSEADEVSENG